MKQMDVRAFIKQLGGPTQLHRKLQKAGYDITLQAINMWVYRNNIPSRWLYNISLITKVPLHKTPAVDGQEMDFLE